MDYLDFELEIGPGLGREYPVAVIRSPAGEARETMTFPFDELALENRLKDLQIALLRSGGKRRRALSPEEQTVQDFGRDLFKALVGGEILSRYEVSRREARQQRKGLRFKLRFQAPELAALPWEFLYDHRRGEYLCLSKNTPTIRYLELPQPIPSLTVTPPLRILGMIASPTDLPRLDVEPGATAYRKRSPRPAKARVPGAYLAAGPDLARFAGSHVGRPLAHLPFYRPRRLRPSHR